MTSLEYIYTKKKKTFVIKFANFLCYLHDFLIFFNLDQILTISLQQRREGFEPHETWNHPLSRAVLGGRGGTCPGRVKWGAGCFFKKWSDVSLYKNKRNSNRDQTAADFFLCPVGYVIIVSVSGCVLILKRLFELICFFKKASTVLFQISPKSNRENRFHLNPARGLGWS